MRSLRTVAVLLLSIILAGCNLGAPATPTSPGAPTLDLGQIVQATLQAMTAQASARAPSATPAASPSPAATAQATGSISGSLNYPADKLPPMYVVAYRVGTSHYDSITTTLGQSSYRIEHLAPGTYHVIAYTVGGEGFPAGLAGGYTQAVPCGLATECANHTLIDVEVTAGKNAAGVNVFDWYAPPGTFPPFPGQLPVATPTAAADTGGIAGTLMYPASALPALRIVAFRVGTPSYHFTETAPGQSSYQLNGLPAGTYHVVAYVIPGDGFTGGLAGGYSQMVLCGLKAGCSDHTLVDVVVTAGHVTTAVDPNDYYADAGTFPPEPVP